MNQPPTTAPPIPDWEQSMELLDSLPALSLAERAESLRRLLRNPSPAVRERALRVGATVLSQETLVRYLRDDADAVLRNAGLEIFKLRGARSFSLAVELLQDPDPDLVLQAVLILDHIRDPRALEPLRAILAHHDVNIAQAAIVAVGRLGDARAIPDLLPFLSADTWLQMAAVQALGDLRSAQAVPALSRLLTDLMIGPMAAEALARIGGGRTFRALGAHWLRYHEQLDPETMLGLLAHVAEGLSRPPRQWDELRASLAERLRDPYAEVRVSAARCLLALGAGAEDAEALALVAAAAAEAAPLPSCLARRADLIATLLERRAVQRYWGYQLACLHPRQVTVEELAVALAHEADARQLAPVAELLSKRREPALARPLLDLYLRLPRAARSELTPALRAHRKALDAARRNRPETRPVDRLVLAAHLGESAPAIARSLLELPPAARVEAVAQLADRPAVLRRLPWRRWLQDEPETWADVAAQLAVQAGLRELLPALRSALRRAAKPDLIRAAGELGDRDSVPQLVELLEHGERALQPLVVESLGRIGGPAARLELRRLATTAEPGLERHAFRALAACATGEDEELFRRHASHADWLVRLACVEVLGRFDRPENFPALTQLAADPVAIVSQRALACLEG